MSWRFIHYVIYFGFHLIVLFLWRPEINQSLAAAGFSWCRSWKPRRDTTSGKSVQSMAGRPRQQSMEQLEINDPNLKSNMSRIKSIQHTQRHAEPITRLPRENMVKTCLQEAATRCWMTSATLWFQKQEPAPPALEAAGIQLVTSQLNAPGVTAEWPSSSTLGIHWPVTDPPERRCGSEKLSAFQ